MKYVLPPVDPTSNRTRLTQGCYVVTMTSSPIVDALSQLRCYATCQDTLRMRHFYDAATMQI